MNSFTGIFRQHFKPPMLPPSNFEELPYVLNTGGKPCFVFFCVLCFLETLV